MACPELAPLIQSGEEVDERLVDTVAGYCAPLRSAGVDTVILGCTHYPLVRPVIQRALGRGVEIVSSGQAIADAVHAALGPLENDRERERRLHVPLHRRSGRVPPRSARASCSSRSPRSTASSRGRAAA